MRAGLSQRVLPPSRAWAAGASTTPPGFLRTRARASGDDSQPLEPQGKREQVRARERERERKRPSLSPPPQSKHTLSVLSLLFARALAVARFQVLTDIVS